MATQSQDLPTIVLIQGSFQIPQVYEKLVHLLVARGYSTVHPKLPSCTDPEGSDFPQRSLTDDAAAIHTELARLIQQEGKTVIVVLHSYGGLVGTEAVAEELTWTSRQAQGQPGGVIHLFFFCAFILDQGQSVLGTFGESPNTDVHSDGRSFILHGAEKLYNDLPPDEAALWESRLVAQSYRVQETQLTRAAWKYIPSTYLVTENDQAVPPQYQEAFAKQAGATVERCSSGHSAQLSQPEMLVQKIVEASKRAMAGVKRQG
ncbi:MAG: hypothetical protein Q9197_001373 [Variospora fuerteventurae]